jgi:hypothetical protein
VCFSPQADIGGAADRRRGRLRLFGRRAAHRQAAAELREQPAGQPASDVPASVPAPADKLTNGSRP